jgi:hypothetical protein
MAAPYRITRPAVVAVATTASDALKQYLERLLKLIPAEVVTLYLFGVGLIPATRGVLLICWAVFCLLAVVLVRAYGTADGPRGVPPQWGAVGLSCVAFVIWVYTLGGPFKTYDLHDPIVGSLLVAGFTFVVPYLYRG